jgi:hypothetical protein
VGTFYIYVVIEDVEDIVRFNDNIELFSVSIYLSVENLASSTVVNKDTTYLDAVQGWRLC